jgi:hypothetical protein
MQGFVTKIVNLMMENELFAWQGGPIIMAQVGRGEPIIDQLWRLHFHISVTYCNFITLFPVAVMKNLLTCCECRLRTSMGMLNGSLAMGESGMFSGRPTWPSALMRVCPGLCASKGTLLETS